MAGSAEQVPLNFGITILNLLGENPAGVGKAEGEGEGLGAADKIIDTLNPIRATTTMRSLEWACKVHKYPTNFCPHPLFKSVLLIVNSLPLKT